MNRTSNQQGGPLVIAHRGASALLPEHTFEAKVLAAAMGADYLEQDIYLSRDGQAIVCHDPWLDNLTDAADLYPNLKGADGHVHIRDLTWEQIRTLHAGERMDGSVARYANRFPAQSRIFSIHRLEDEIALICGLEKTLQRPIGLYPEIKQPAMHRKHGLDPSAEVFGLLKAAGFDSSSRIFLQTFDFNELKRWRTEFQSDLPSIALISDREGPETPVTVSYLMSDAGLAELKEYATGIGPWIGHLIARQKGKIIPSAFAERLDQSPLKVHPWTFRREDVPDPFETLEAWLEFAVANLPMDGYFIDEPIRPRRRSR